MRAPNTVHKWLLSLILLIGCLSVSAKEKEYILFLSSVNAEEAWIHGFRNELQKRFPYEGNIELHEYFLAVPVLTNAEEVKQAQDNLLQTFPTPPKVVIIVGDPVDFRLKLFDECQSFLDVIRLFQYGDIVVFVKFFDRDTVCFCQRSFCQ